MLAAAMAGPAFDARENMFIAMVAVAGLRAWIVWQDLSTFTISDAAVTSLMLIAAGLKFHERDGTLAGMSVPLGADVVLPGTFMLALREYFYRRRGYDGLGLGPDSHADMDGLKSSLAAQTLYIKTDAGPVYQMRIEAVSAGGGTKRATAFVAASPGRAEPYLVFRRGG